MKTSKNYYNSIAKDYSDISAKRRHYLERVNELVITHAPQQVDYADIGAGDGVRSLLIAQGIKARSCTLIDESAELLEFVPSDISVTKINSSINDIDLVEKFDVVTCLWNVLGHLPSLPQRDKAIERISAMTKPGGMVFTDVNNRYNIPVYGQDNVMKNIGADNLNSPEKGWFPISQSDASTLVYIHGPFELDRIFECYGLEVENKYFIDYDSGIVHPDFWKGQTFYQLRKSRSSATE